MWKERGIFETGIGRRWVIDCITGKLIEIGGARYIGESRGLHYWITRRRSIAGVPRHILKPSRPPDTEAGPGPGPCVRDKGSRTGERDNSKQEE